MFSSSDVNTYTARFGLQKPCCMTLRLKAQMEIKFAKYVPSIIFSKFCHFQNIMMDILVKNIGYYLSETIIIWER